MMADRARGVPHGLFHVFITIIGIYTVDGFGDGAPNSVCLTMFPKHGSAVQAAPSPFSISPSDMIYQPSQRINLTLKAFDDRTYTGIQINAHRETGDTEELLGTFVYWPEYKTKAVNCVDQKAKMVTHKNSLAVQELLVTWQAPDVNVGNITFRATFVQNYDVYWTNVKTTIASETPVQQALINAVSIEPLSINFDDCGETMGCVLYPKLCSGSDCDVGMAYVTDGDNVTFTMFAKTQNYISIGFSDDKLMGHDQTQSCLSSGEDVAFQHGYNPMLFNYQQYKGERLTNMSSSYRDGVLYCKFTRPKSMDVYSYETDPITFDLNTDYYVMLAWGKIYPGTQVMSKHKELPVTTTEKVKFNSYRIYRPESLPLLTRIHGILTLVAWILFAGITTVISRYYKPLGGKKELLGTKIWFQIHRGAGILTVVLTTISFVIIFIKVYGLTNDAVIHGWVGIAVMAAAVLQVLGGFIRPGPKSDIRVAFNWGHWFLGKSTHILAATSVFLAFDADIITKSQRLFGIIVTAVWVGVQVVWELLFEMRKCCVSGKKSEKYDVSKTSETTEPRLATLDKVLLVLYICFLLIIVAVSAIAVFAF